MQGRWSLTAPLFEGRAGPRAAHARAGEVLLERYGIVTRETVLAEGIPGGFSGLYGELVNLETLGTARRGYFVEGLGGAQFALPRRSSACAGCAPTSPPGALVLAATDPANPYGATLPWPKRDDESPGRAARAACAGGRYVVTLDAEPVLYVERGGQGPACHCASRTRPGCGRGARGAGRRGEARARAAARHRALRRRAGGRLETGELLIELGFRQGPRKLTLSA